MDGLLNTLKFVHSISADYVRHFGYGDEDMNKSTQKQNYRYL